MKQALTILTVGMLLGCFAALFVWEMRIGSSPGTAPDGVVAILNTQSDQLLRWIEAEERRLGEGGTGGFETGITVLHPHPTTRLQRFVIERACHTIAAEDITVATQLDVPPTGNLLVAEVPSILAEHVDDSVKRSHGSEADSEASAARWRAYRVRAGLLRERLDRLSRVGERCDT